MNHRHCVQCGKKLGMFNILDYKLCGICRKEIEDMPGVSSVIYERW